MKRVFAICALSAIVVGCGESNRPAENAPYNNPESPAAFPPARGGEMPAPARTDEPQTGTMMGDAGYSEPYRGTTPPSGTSTATPTPTTSSTGTTPPAPSGTEMKPGGTSGVQGGATGGTTGGGGDNTAETDRALTQRIRRALATDKSLSMTAKNVTIITSSGKVTLKGQVKTTKEHDTIVATAKRIAGDSQVDDQLEVK